MRVPWSWLKEYVDLEGVSPQEAAERLTFAGLEVEEVERIGEWWGEQIRVGQILAWEKHPNADRLSLVTVDFGAPEPLTVVTGAPNVTAESVGRKVVFASVGAVLIDGHADDGRKMKLKASKIRGVRSEGMVCSEKELGLSDEHEGILFLPDDAPVGAPLIEVLGDWVLEVYVTPNRGDCLSILGIARELGAILDRPFRIPEVVWPAADRPPAPVRIVIEDPDLCRRYIGVLIEDVTVGQAPFWVQHRLRLAGQRPLGNVVDATNYVMLEVGQPLHAFDWARIRGGEIRVRRARPGETLRTLDGVERPLDPERLLIADAEGPIALAGVMGGEETEVGPETRAVLLESATFHPVSVRRTALHYGLRTEASQRFEKGIDPQRAEWAAKRAALLIAAWSGGRLAGDLVDAYPAPEEPRRLTFPKAEIPRLLGVEVEDEAVEGILGRLGFELERTDGGWEVRVPSWRRDVAQPADLVEEVARIQGYDRLPTSLLPEPLPPYRPDPLHPWLTRARRAALQAGLTEAITYAFTARPQLARLLPPGVEVDEGAYLKLLNPKAPERAWLRRQLLETLTEALERNLRQHRPTVRLFEVGQVFLGTADEDQPWHLAALLAGAVRVGDWRGEPAGTLDFFHAKGLAESLLSRLGVPDVAWVPADDLPFLHPGRAARIEAAGQVLGWVGELHPAAPLLRDLPVERVAALELDLTAVARVARPFAQMRPVSPYPAVIQDLAVLVPAGTPAAQVESLLREAGGVLLEALELFDRYEGPAIPEGHVSLAYRAAFRAPDRPLTDRDVAKVRKRILKALKKAGWSLRGAEG